MLIHKSMSHANTFNESRSVWRFSSSNLLILGLSLLTGFALCAFDGGPRTFLAATLGIAVLILLILHPEFALALYVVVGDVKGDDRVAALFPVDLTLLLGGVLLTGIAVNYVRKRRLLPMPPVYFLFIAWVVLMAASLTYTPVFAAGLDKIARFLTVTGVVIVGPFFVLGSLQVMKRFFLCFGVVAFAICGYSLSSLGGSERLATPSDNTIGLGHNACALILLLWFAVISRYPFPRRMVAYLLLIVPGVALVGSGSRGSTVACAIVIFLSLFFYRRLLVDVICMAAIGITALPFLRIPESSIEYLGTLVGSRSVSALLSFRGDLLDFGWKLLMQHPLIGAGIQGFRYSSPNPGLYNWPHNIFLEVACELGIPAALLVCVIFGSTIRETILQLTDQSSPYFAISQLTAALFLIGMVNAMNTGDINSDRSTWLFVSLVFVVRGYRTQSARVFATANTADCMVPAR
jgi:O-antigen ligase